MCCRHHDIVNTARAEGGGAAEEIDPHEMQVKRRSQRDTGLISRLRPM